MPLHDKGQGENSPSDIQNFSAEAALKDGSIIKIRTIRSDDQEKMKAFFESLSRETLRLRFMALTRIPSQDELTKLVTVDFSKNMLIVATVTTVEGEEIVAEARYALDSKTNLAETAILVADQWRRKGIGTLMLAKLAGIAKKRGIKGFYAEVAVDNTTLFRLLDSVEAKGIDIKRVYTYQAILLTVMFPEKSIEEILKG